MIITVLCDCMNTGSFLIWSNKFYSNTVIPSRFPSPNIQWSFSQTHKAFNLHSLFIPQIAGKGTTELRNKQLKILMGSMTCRQCFGFFVLHRRADRISSGPLESLRTFRVICKIDFSISRRQSQCCTLHYRSCKYVLKPSLYIYLFIYYFGVFLISKRTNQPILGICGDENQTYLITQTLTFVNKNNSFSKNKRLQIPREGEHIRPNKYFSLQLYLYTFNCRIGASVTDELRSNQSINKTWNICRQNFNLAYTVTV